MRLFELHRDHDVSGVSGTGVVAEGVEFSDGTCVVRWVTERGSTVVWRSIDDVEAIHGHGGATRVVWIDSENGRWPRRTLRPAPIGPKPSEPAGR
jgi:hypothetical protein